MPQYSHEAQREFYRKESAAHTAVSISPLQSFRDGKGGVMDEYVDEQQAKTVAAAFRARGISVRQHQRFVEYSIPA